MNSDQKIQRRSFIQGAGAFTFVLPLVDIFGPNYAHGATGEVELNAWVMLQPTGEIIIYNPMAEMGQGTGTALPMVIAEEMDLDWSQVRVVTSPADAETYGFGFHGSYRMLTAGSWAIRRYYTRLRLVGAQARRVLLENASAKWQVPVSELTTAKSVVAHKKSSRKTTYAALVNNFKAPAILPEIKETELKDPKNFTILGQSVPRYDVPSKVDGSLKYSIDVDLPNMLVGVVERAPVHDDKPFDVDLTAVKKAHPKVQAVTLAHGVGLLGQSFEEVMAARKLLKVKWKRQARAVGFSSEKELQNYRQAEKTKGVEFKTMHEAGDYPRARQQKDLRTISTEYFSDHAYHAQMEPLNAVAQVDTKNQTAAIWIGSQEPAGIKKEAAELLGFPLEKVTVHRHLLGGGFGRRSLTDFGLEAVNLAKAAGGRPVKLIWTREDDIAWGAFRPMSLVKIEAGIDQKGELVTWQQKSIGDGPHLLRSGITIPDYAVPHQKISMGVVPHGIRLKHWRSVGHNSNKFAIECALDELAKVAGQDPFEIRKKLLKESPRALAVVERVAKMADWTAKRPKGHGLGMAYVDRSHSYGAAVCEASVDAATGKIKLHQFWVAVDAGILLHPDNAVAQIEGGVVYGISSALRERITVQDGVVQQTNFGDYRLARMSDIPDIAVEFIESMEPPTGVGESSTPLVAPAIANAVAAATGKWVKHQPMTPERVKAALAIPAASTTL